MRENAIKPIIITIEEVTVQPYPVPYVFHRPGGPSAADFLPGEPAQGTQAPREGNPQQTGRPVGGRHRALGMAER